MQSHGLIGSRLGAYQIDQIVGRGGMGQVYRAMETAVDRHVAIKVLPAELAANPDFVARFRREARIVAGLQHPNILPIFTFGEQDGMLYLVMPYVTGGTLEQLLHTGKSPDLPNVVRIVSGIAGALDYAHRRGVVHRDLKPANVLLDESGSPVVADFGIARLVQETGLTQTGAAIGTPGYMSPEQGLGQHVDGRSDIYSLGIILYQLLTGRVPFVGDSAYSVIYQHIHEAPPAIRSIRPDVPASIDAIVMRALMKKPEDRFQTGAELATALNNAITGPTLLPTAIAGSGLARTEVRPIIPSPAIPVGVGPKPVIETKRPGSRWLLPFGVGLGIGLLILVGAGAAFALNRPLPPRPPGAQGRLEAPQLLETATPAAIAATPVPPTPVPPTPVPPASPTAVPTDPRNEVYAVALRSNEVWAEALKNVEVVRLPDVYAGQALREVGASVLQLRNQGRYRLVEPIEITRVAVDIDGDRAMVRTMERWRDRVYQRDTNALVSERNPWIFRQVYSLQRIDGVWKVVDTQLN